MLRRDFLQGFVALSSGLLVPVEEPLVHRAYSFIRDNPLVVPSGWARIMTAAGKVLCEFPIDASGAGSNVAVASGMAERVRFGREDFHLEVHGNPYVVRDLTFSISELTITDLAT